MNQELEIKDQLFQHPMEQADANQADQALTDTAAYDSVANQPFEVGHQSNYDWQFLARIQIEAASKPFAEDRGALASMSDPSEDLYKSKAHFEGFSNLMSNDFHQEPTIEQLLPQRSLSPKLVPVTTLPFTDLAKLNHLNISHAIENVMSMLDIEPKAEVPQKQASMFPIQQEASKDQSLSSNLPIPAYLHSSHDFSNSTSQAFNPPDDDEDRADSKTERVDSLENGRFQMFNHQISHSKYRTIYQGVDNETGCEIAWSCYLLQRHDTFKKEELLKKLSKVKQITKDEQTDTRARYILRVIHFELRPAKHHKIHNLNERRVKLNTSTRDSKLVSSRASNLNFSTAMSIKTKHEADSNENAQEQLIVVTELTTTGSLREYLRKIQHPRLKVIKEWLYKILEAVSFLHQNEIVHGKITCESIYYNSNVAEIKVGDIGIKHIYAQAQGREDENRLTKQNDVRCIGVALLEMILAPEIPQNTHAYLKKIFSKLPQEKILEHIKHAELRELTARVIYVAPSKRPTCEQLLQHPFLQIKPEDKEIDVQSLHTLQKLVKDTIKRFNSISPNIKATNVGPLGSKRLAIHLEPVETSFRDVNQSKQQLTQTHEAATGNNETSSSHYVEGSFIVPKARETASALTQLHKNIQEADISGASRLHPNSKKNSGKKKILLKRNKSEFPIKEETNEPTDSSGNVLQTLRVAEIQTIAKENSSQQRIVQNSPEVGSKSKAGEPKLASIKEAQQDMSTLLKSVSVSQHRDNDHILQFVIDVRTKNRMFTVRFEYDLDKDHIDTLVEEMKHDLHLSEPNIKFLERKLTKAVTRYMQKRERRRERTAQFLAEKAEETKAAQALDSIRFAQLAALDLKSNKNLRKYSRQSSSLRDEDKPRAERRSDEKIFDDNLLSIRPEQFSEEPDVPTSPQHIDMSQVSHLSEQDQDSAKERNELVQNLEALKEDLEGTEKETKNNAVIQHSQVMEPHNNTTGEMHEAIIREQQQNGPIGGRDVVANQCFRNSLTYVDQELQSFMYNSNDQKRYNEMLQAEKEKERDRSNQQRNQKKARDEEIAFQQIIHDIKEMFILEAMFPNYAREYHEIQDNQCYGPQTQEQLEAVSHHQSMPISSPRHNTTNEIILSLSFECDDHRVDNFHPIAQAAAKSSEELPEFQGFTDLSMIYAQDNEIEFLFDLNTLEESKNEHKNIGNQLLDIIKARQDKHKQDKQKQTLPPHATQSYISDGLGMSSLFEQSNLTKDRQIAANKVAAQANSSEIRKGGPNVGKTQANYQLKSNKTLNLILQGQQNRLHQPPQIRKTSQYQNESEPFDSPEQASSIKQEFLDTPIPQSSGSLVDSNKAGNNGPMLNMRQQSSSFVESSTHQERCEEESDEEGCSAVSSEEQAQKLLILQVVPKEVKKERFEANDVEKMTDQAIQSAVRDIYAKLNDSFSQPMESERLEAKFKKMKKRDVITLRVALTLILPSLINPGDDATSEVSHSTNNFESLDKLSLMNAEPSGQLFCKKTRRVVKRFKKVNGMVPDSIVDGETWDKIMLKAKDILPVRINEQASIQHDKREAKYSLNQRVLLSLRTFNRDFQAQLKLCVKPDSKQVLTGNSKNKAFDSTDADNASTPLNSVSRRAEDTPSFVEESKRSLTINPQQSQHSFNRCQSMEACKPLFQTVLVGGAKQQQSTQASAPTSRGTLLVQKMSAPDLIALQRLQELPQEQIQESLKQSEGELYLGESPVREDTKSFGAVEEISALSQSGTEELTVEEIKQRLE